MKKIYLFAIIFALLAGFSTWFFVNSLKHNSAITGIEENQVLIALQDIEKDTVLTPDMFKEVTVPRSGITYGTLVNAYDVNGYVAAQRISKGEQVLASKIVLYGEEGNGLDYTGEYRLSYNLGEGKYAYTISVESTDTVARFIRRGDYVNIYVNGAVHAAHGDNSNTTGYGPFLQNIKVLEIGTYSDRVASETGTVTIEYDLLTLELTGEQVEDIIQYNNSALAGDVGFNVVLVPYVEGAEITTLPEPTTVNENGETVTVPRVAEPATNYGMGEIMTDPPVTVAE